MKDILLALPVYNGELTAQTAAALLLAMEESHERGWKLRCDNIHFRVGDADIGAARNVFLGLLLDSKCTDLVYIDSDVSWGPGNFTRLMEPEVDFLAGIYRAKTDAEICYPVIWRRPGQVFTDPATGRHLLEVDGVAAGFMRLSRAGVQKIFDASERKFEDIKHGKTVLCPWVFEFTTDANGERKSEDYIFCKRWREVVGPCYLDPSIRLNHTGKKTYEGDVYEMIKNEVVADMHKKRFG